MTKKASKKTSTPRTTSTSTFEWKEPPARTRTGTFSFPAEELKKKKNQWALVKTTTGKSAGSAVSYIKKALEKREMEGFEVMSRGNEVYARFAG
jgi:hypothetical protein